MQLTQSNFTSPFPPTFVQHDSPSHSSHSLLDEGAQPLPSESLLRGHKTVEIVHNGSLYKLQATKLGKLILTK